jgi:hypothetical protein
MKTLDKGSDKTCCTSRSVDRGPRHAFAVDETSPNMCSNQCDTPTPGAVVEDPYRGDSAEAATTFRSDDRAVPRSRPL